jgi:hypothetical protein
VVWWRAAGMSRVDVVVVGQRTEGEQKLQHRQASKKKKKTARAMGSGQGVLRECCPSGGAGGATDVLAMRSAG